MDGTASIEQAFTVTEDEASAQVLFFVGSDGSAENSVCVDNVAILAAGTELVPDGGFDEGQGAWFTSGVSSTTVADSLCVEIPAASAPGNPWDAIVGLNDLTLPSGDYVLAFDASGTQSVRGLVGLQAAPYTVFGEVVETPGDGTRLTSAFTINEETTGAQVAFQVGGKTTDWTFCVDNVSLMLGGTLPPYSPETGPRVRVNQVGYLTHGPKEATLVTAAEDPVAWDLAAEDGSTVASGTTTPLGEDASAGLTVHGIDFSDVTEPGTYTLSADGETSYAFEIGTEAYATLRTDALNYFYLARSGIDIDAAIVGDDYAREAGHVSSPSDGTTNKGDLDVPCQNAADAEAVYGEPWTCGYTLDVVGGWYDAGDHGKYVVNGGIATAQLLGTFERSKTAPTAQAGALADGTLAVPETDNGVPDVLDEARWELEFMMAMQVPDGEQYAGMVHHKIHDDGWTGLPLLPAADPQVREPASAIDRRDPEPCRHRGTGSAPVGPVRRRVRRHAARHRAQHLGCGTRDARLVRPCGGRCRRRRPL
ncbi:hypothetical protein GCM10025876_06280 [Demequina litorisediminis]|uniref:Uncharacterized protein n=1 Tax=Demequina litorisediminis TaxID=1849022 RepID=A0ABQ6ICF4_9MICO|nr:hypothetical protein GCM10025876_06280 [Demequina litorisediminis]